MLELLISTEHLLSIIIIKIIDTFIPLQVFKTLK